MAYPQSVINRTIKRSLDNIEDMNPAARQKFSRFISDVLSQLGVPLLVYSTNRSYDEQEVLHKKYISGVGHKAAKPGYSWHNFRRAGDVVPLLPSEKADWNSPLWNKIGAIGMKHGLSWGKSFGDTNHFSDRSGTSLSKLRAEKPVPQKSVNFDVAKVVAAIGLGIVIYRMYKDGYR